MVPNSVRRPISSLNTVLRRVIGEFSRVIKFPRFILALFVVDMTQLSKREQVDGI